MFSTKTSLTIAPEFKEYFRELKQVFLYITDDCSLRCVHCLYKPNLIWHKELKLDTTLSLMAEFRKMGARKLTFIGGEPTRYGYLDNYKPLLTAISEAKELGYEYVILDTNGQFDDILLEKKYFKLLDELSFSFDGHTPAINDSLRGKGTFNRSLSNLKTAVELGYNVRITTLVHKGNIGRDRKGNLLLNSMIDFVTSVGASQINFHPLFKMGIARDAWTGEIDISPEEWIAVYSEIRRNIDVGKYNIPVRIPLRFVSRKEFDSDPTYYGYCPVQLGERVLVHPNGMIRVCALLIGTPYGVARFDDHQIIWDSTITNELCDHDLSQPTPCANQRMHLGDLVPLCISFKPKQEELIWKEIMPSR